VNQTAGHVEAETEKPQNQEHNENCPKHVALLRSIEGQLKRIDLLSFLLYLVALAGASVFPHSRQEALEREVIKPQNGHILCDA
jgi:hypothetical protein